MCVHVFNFPSKVHVGVCVCVCLYSRWKGGALNRGPSSPDLKRHSFITANLLNINMRASTSLSLRARRATLPDWGWGTARVQDCVCVLLSARLFVSGKVSASSFHFNSLLYSEFLLCVCVCYYKGRVYQTEVWLDKRDSFILHNWQLVLLLE